MGSRFRNLPRAVAAALTLRSLPTPGCAVSRRQRAEGTLDRLFDATWAGSDSGSRDFGDREDRGTAPMAVKRFF